MLNYLLEIGVEELPSRYIDDALSQIGSYSKNMLSEYSISYDAIKTYATPRRLVLLIENIGERQPEREEIVRGPSAKIAFDEDKNPTKPLQGFLKSQGLDVDDIYTEVVKNTEYVFAKKTIPGKDIREVLKVEIPELIKKIHFEKTMRWGGKQLRFARPIRWLLSILEDEVLEFDLEGIVASNVTRGHRFLASSNIEVNNVHEYEKLLEENYVILDQNKRKDIIKYGTKKLAKSVGGEIKDDEDLLNELTYIVEYPTPIMGSVKEEYLKLPKIVITTPMREHLRFTPVLDSDGELMPYFITIRNGVEDYKDIVIAGNEKVLGARLEDAKFFYNDDIEKGSEFFIDELKKITFQEKLGTIFEKTNRVEKLSIDIGNVLEVGEETINSVRRAAELSKFDLATKMVQEFTELQGAIGRIYTSIWGEPEIVSKAIEEQYMPRYAGGELPSTTTGSILAIADKLDTIVGLFAVDLIPTGSQDPFGLRRNAIGIINIINERHWDISIAHLVDYSLYAYVNENNLVFDYEKVKENILNFFVGRTKNILLEREIRYDVVDSIVDNDDSLITIFEKGSALNEYFKKDLSSEIEAFLRIKNIVSKNPSLGKVSEELFEQDEEKKLYEAYSEIKDSYQTYVDQREYEKALDLIFGLKDFVHTFFDNVMVMSDKEEVKDNRLSLLCKIDEDLNKIFDIGKIVEQ